MPCACVWQGVCVASTTVAVAPSSKAFCSYFCFCCGFRFHVFDLPALVAAARLLVS